MSQIRIEIEDEQLRRIMRRAPAAIAAEVGTAVNDVAQVAFGRSQDIVPRDTGTLARSGMVEVVTVQGGIEARISYGGPAKDYAMIVHETDRNYQRGKEWKYLERPVAEAAPLFGNRVRQAVAETIRRYGR